MRLLPIVRQRVVRSGLAGIGELRHWFSTCRVDVTMNHVTGLRCTQAVSFALGYILGGSRPPVVRTYLPTLYNDLSTLAHVRGCHY